MYLTKSDFKVARTCGTKLYYRKKNYPSNQSDNEYLRFLADGGYMVEELARARFPDGRTMPEDPVDLGLDETRKAMNDSVVTLFEASFLVGQLFARLDILERRGDVLRIIEVKAKSFDADDGANPFRGVMGAIKADWRPYLEDVTFQTLVLQRQYPEATVIPCLCLVDKSAKCDSDSLFKQFVFDSVEASGRRPRVTYRGDREALQKTSLVQIFDVSPEVAELMPEVVEAADSFVETLTTSAVKRISPQLGNHCKSCEFRFPLTDKRERHGFCECWGELANHEYHLLDLYRVDVLEKTGDLGRLIESGSTSLLDVRKEMLRGSIGERQAIQLENTRQGREHINPKLPQLLKELRYPLHFMDFEASRLAVPYHAGMRPYEQVLFQWSCHTITEPDAAPIHREWINVDDAYPNIEFTQSLREVLGETGTVFVWSSFEKSALTDARRQLAQHGRVDPDLESWLAMMIGDDSPLVDLCELAKQYYFHPQMKGSLSVKQVLPAVWSSSSALRRHHWFSEYQKEESGRYLDPYETLPRLPFENGEIEVREGTSAMRTYQEMMYGVKSQDRLFRDLQRQALLNYCKLDTAAMVMIWLRWTGQA